MKLTDFFGFDNFFVSKEVAKKTNNDSAILLAFLVQKNALANGESFTATIQEIQAETNLSYKQQKPCIEKLVKLGYITCELKGLPAKNYFSILKTA